MNQDENLNVFPDSGATEHHERMNSRPTTSGNRSTATSTATSMDCGTEETPGTDVTSARESSREPIPPHTLSHAEKKSEVPTNTVNSTEKELLSKQDVLGTTGVNVLVDYEARVQRKARLSTAHADVSAGQESGTTGGDPESEVSSSPSLAHLEALIGNIPNQPSATTALRSRVPNAADDTVQKLISPLQRGSLFNLEDDINCKDPSVTETSSHGDIYEPTMGLHTSDDLAHAVPVVEQENCYKPTAVQYDPDMKPPANASQRVRNMAIAMVLLVVVVAVTVGVTVAMRQKTDRTKDTRDAVERLVGSDNLGKAPYLQALEWITHNDTMELVPEDGVQFEQRYILAYTYFALTRDHDWDDCNRFEEGATSNLCTCVGCVPRRGGTKWLGTDSECNWSGNFCNENGVLEKIQLNMVNATGSFPEGVFHLSSLISLNIDMNQLDGRLPSDLSALPDLEELILSGNAFTGPIPDKWFGMNKLTTLKLEKNSITGTLSTRIGELTSLENLILTSNQIASTIPTEIALPPLVFVELEQNFFNGTIPTEVGNMEKMRELLLDINNLVGEIPTELGSCSNLAFFTASENALTGGLPDELFDLKKLQWIKLELNSLNGTISTSFGTLTEMTELYLNDNDFTGTVPTELGELTKMEEFRLSGTMLNGAVPQEVCDLHDSVIGLLVSADCDSDKIDCDCCTSCCDAEGENCRNVEP